MFAREGASVVGCDIDQKAADETLAIAKAEGLSYESFVADLTDPAASDKLMQFAVDRFGKLNILVTAAAFVEFAPLRSSTTRNTGSGRSRGTRPCLPALQSGLEPHEASGGASIINFASANAYVSLSSGALAHCATKGGFLP